MFEDLEVANKEYEDLKMGNSENEKIKNKYYELVIAKKWSRWENKRIWRRK